jgi:hypothetical protein
VIPVPEICRVEYPGREGLQHHGAALLDPERYARKLEARGVRARVTVLDADLQPGKVFEARPPCADCAGIDHTTEECLL